MAKAGRLIDTYIALREQIAQLVTRIVPPKEVEDVVQETCVRICRVDPKEAIRRSRSYVWLHGTEPGPRPHEAFRIVLGRRVSSLARWVCRHGCESNNVIGESPRSTR